MSMAVAQLEPTNLESGPRTAALIKENRSPAETRHPLRRIPDGNLRESTMSAV